MFNPSSAQRSVTIDVPEADVDTALTLSVPSNVGPGDSIKFTGKLTRNDTGEGIGGQTLVLELLWVTTSYSFANRSDGTYSITLPAPTVVGTYQYKVSFAGSPSLGLRGSQSKTRSIGISDTNIIALALSLAVLGYIIFR